MSDYEKELRIIKNTLLTACNLENDHNWEQIGEKEITSYQNYCTMYGKTGANPIITVTCTQSTVICTRCGRKRKIKEIR